MKKNIAAALISGLCFLPAFAQSQEVVVTGIRAADAYGGIPAVTLAKPADFLVQEVQITNDSRAPDLRKKEINATVEGMLKRAAADKKMALSYGKGFLLPVNLTDESLQIIDDNGRSDTSSVRLFVKVSLAAGDNTKARIADLRNFISHAQVVGRTEIVPSGDVGLSIVNPEKYRYELLARIAEENKRLTKAIGGQCKVKMTELGSRVAWRRTEVAELTLYIPYGVEATDCSYEQ